MACLETIVNILAKLLIHLNFIACPSLALPSICTGFQYLSCGSEAGCYTIFGIYGGASKIKNQANPLSQHAADAPTAAYFSGTPRSLEYNDS